MTIKYCEDCGVELNPNSTFNKCYFCFTGTERPSYDVQATKDLCQEDE